LARAATEDQVRAATRLTRRIRQSRRVWPWLRLMGGLGILGLLVWRVGTGPFIYGIRAVNGTALVAALAVGVVVTVGCAWRWSLIAAGLGVRLPLPAAVAADYRSQFLNTTLPGGVLGDVHRATRHGLDIGDVRLGVRAAVLDRVSGQAVQVAAAVIVLFAFASPVRPYLPAVSAALLVAGLGLAGVLWAGDRSGSGRWARMVRAIGSDLRDGLFADGKWIRIGVASAVVVSGHVATFLIAARAAGVTAPITVLLPLILLVLMATAVPLNIAGWGPREGVAAWAFAATGLSAQWGLATAVTCGILVFVASLPGLAVLLHTWLQRPSQP
jgi:glycosyltransferase 2 family protein